MKIVQILAFASAVSSVIHGNEYSAPASDSMKSTMFTTKEENRIKRGSTIKDYPYIASLRLEGLDTIFCSGTLIDSQYILTAGHCIETKTDVVIAHLGTDFGSSSKGEQIKVISSYRHQTNLYDVGLLKLEKPSTQKTATLCAADGSDNPIGTKATALEWGMTEDGSLSHTLQEVHVSLISSAECKKQYNNNNMEGMMCAGYDGVKDSCSGGNGGPLVTADDILIGFASWRGKCGVSVGIYTRLTFVRDYIDIILSGDTGSSFTDSTLSATQQTPIVLSTTEIAYTPTVARSIPGATTFTGSIAKSIFREPTSAVTPVAATSTPASILASTTAGQMVPVASDCTFRRHLSEEPEPETEEPEPATEEPESTTVDELIEKDLDIAKREKEIGHDATDEADKETEMWSRDSSKDDNMAEEEEQELDEETREDEEDELLEKEMEKIMEEEEDKIDQDKKEDDDTSAKTSDKSSKKTSTKAKAESEEQEETTPVSTKATKKAAKKSKAEEETEEETEEELEEENEKELEEELEDKLGEAEAKKLEEEYQEEQEEKAEEEKEEEEEDEQKEDEALPPTKKPSKNLKSGESEDAKQKEVTREKRTKEEDEAEGQPDEESGSSS